MDNTDAPDDFFLNFGSSANVCDQLRHTIRQEVSDIDSSIVKIEDESRKEDRTSQEMGKSIVHARKEMYNLRRVACDIVDSTNMNEILRNRMMEDLHGELVNPYLLKGKDKKDGDDAMDGDDRSSSPTAVAFLEDRQEEIKVFMATTSKSKNDTVVTIDKKRALEEAKASIELLIVTENLGEKTKLAEKEVDELAKGLENEIRRLRVTKEAVHHARTKSGMHAQEIADYTKTLTTKKAKHEAERKELAALLAKEEADLFQLERSDDIEKKMRDGAHKLELLTKQNSEADAARNCRVQGKEQLESVKQDGAKFEMTSTKNEAELGQKREASAAARKQHDNAKSCQEQVVVQKAHNDRVGTEKIIPGQQEEQELKKNKETLVKGINEAHSNFETKLKELKEEVEVKGVAAQQLVSETKAVFEENDENHTALTHVKLARDELQETTDKECSENEDIASRFAEACDAEKTNKREVKAAKTINREQKLEDIRAKSSQGRQKQEDVLEVYMRATDMIKEVRADELELERLEETRNHTD